MSFYNGTEFNVRNYKPIDEQCADNHAITKKKKKSQGLKYGV